MKPDVTPQPDLQHPELGREIIPKNLSPVLPVLLLAAAGALGTWFRYQIFFNIDFLFGSIFVMIAVRLYGTAWGALCAVIASACTYLLWNHPYAIIIQTCEAVFVGLLFDRGSGRRFTSNNLTLLDTCYWLLPGIPLVGLFYHGVMGISADGALLIALKQSINGVFNALTASLVINAAGIYRTYKGSETVSGIRNSVEFKNLLYNIILFFALCPAMIGVGMNIRDQVRTKEGDITDTLSMSAASSAQAISIWMGTRQDQISVIASSMKGIPATDRAAIQELAVTYKKILPDFLRIGVMDADARAVAWVPKTDEFGKSPVGLDFSDREYAAMVKKNLEPVISDVMYGKIGTPRPLVVIAAPVTRENRFRGIVVGSLDLSILNSFISDIKKVSSADITLLDGHGAVIASTLSGVKALDRLERDEKNPDRRIVKKGVHQVIPRLSGAHIPISERWRMSRYVKEMPLIQGHRWSLVAETSAAPLIIFLNNTTRDHLLTLWGVIVIASVLTFAVSTMLVRPLRKLSELTADLPRKISENQPLEWFRTPISEISALCANFMSMSKKLCDSMEEMEYLNVMLKQQVMDRTNALEEEEERFRRLAENAKDIIYRMRFLPERCFEYVSPAAKVITGYTPEEHYADPDLWMKIVHPDDRCLLQSGSRSGSPLTLRWSGKDGETIWIELHEVPITDESGAVIMVEGIARDITGHKQAEQTIRTQLREKETLLKEIHHRVKNNMQVISSLLNLQSSYINDPGLQLALGESRKRLLTISLFHEKLYRSGNLASVDFGEYTESIVGGLAYFYGRQDIRITLDTGNAYFGVDIAIPLGLIINELVSNCYKHAFPDETTGEIYVILQKLADGPYLLSVRDTGRGFPDDRDFLNPSSMGLELVRILTEQIGGALDMIVRDGTEFRIAFEK